jgi:hypothetical protein
LQRLRGCGEWFDKHKSALLKRFSHFILKVNTQGQKNPSMLGSAAISMGIHE